MIQFPIYWAVINTKGKREVYSDRNKNKVRDSRESLLFVIKLILENKVHHMEICEKLYYTDYVEQFDKQRKVIYSHSF